MSTGVHSLAILTKPWSMLGLLAFLSAATVCINGLCMSKDCLHERIQKCCRDNGKRIGTRADCLRFCGFNITGDLLISEGGSCTDQLQVLMYCSSEGSDHTSCCRSNKVPDKCAPFCRGDVSRLCPDDIGYEYSECIDHIDTILDCHKRGLSSDDIEWTTKGKAPKMKTCKPRN